MPPCRIPLSLSLLTRDTNHAHTCTQHAQTLMHTHPFPGMGSPKASLAGNEELPASKSTALGPMDALQQPQALSRTNSVAGRVSRAGRMPVRQASHALKGGDGAALSASLLSPEQWATQRLTSPMHWYLLAYLLVPSSQAGPAADWLARTCLGGNGIQVRALFMTVRALGCLTHMCRIGQNRTHTPYMTVCLMMCLPKYRIYIVYMWFWPTLHTCLPRYTFCLLYTIPK